SAAHQSQLTSDSSPVLRPIQLESIGPKTSNPPTSTSALRKHSTSLKAIHLRRRNGRESRTPSATEIAVMNALIAPVRDQRASTKPTAINNTLPWAREVICFRLELSRSSASAGTAPCNAESRLSIVPAEVVRVKMPTATSSSDGIAKKVEYESADARRGTWLASADLPAETAICHHSRSRKSRSRAAFSGF